MSGAMVADGSAAAETTADAVAMAIAAQDAARHRLAALADDHRRPATHRLNDRIRHAMDSALDDAVTEAERDLCLRAQRILKAEGQGAIAARLNPRPADDRMPGLLVTLTALSADLAGVAMLADRAARLPVHSADDPDEPGFLASLCQSEDRRIAAAARMVMALDPLDGSVAALSIGQRQAILWALAAMIERDHAALTGDDRLTLRCGLVEAAQALTDQAAESPDALGAAERLVAAIDPRPAELSFLLIESIKDRRLPLFCALLARATALSPRALAGIVADADDPRLWLALRAGGLNEESLAMILAILTAAMPLADLAAQETAMAGAARYAPEQAAALILPLRLPDAYRANLVRRASMGAGA
ncbi:hypothetical protein ACPVPU_11890 [Sphingomonas sp. CJ99]